jgi:predicted transcriptional regulator
MYKSLGRDPNAKEYEIKSLVQDFDKVARKLIAKVKKGKNEQLYSR